MVSANGSLGLDSSLQLLQPSVMSTSEKPKRLKIKLPKVIPESEIISADATLKNQGNSCFDGIAGVSHSSHDLKLRFSFNSGNNLITTSHKEKSVTKKSKLQKNTGSHPADMEMEVSERCSVLATVTKSYKRLPETMLDNQRAKKRKIGSRVMLQCATLLKKLMIHRHGWMFKEAVDPVALQIPDYFDVISKPMDFGTINLNLEKKLYSNPEEFAADVRLTFANALLYNPPSNKFHTMAKEVKSFFEMRWEALEAQWNAASLELEQHSNSVERVTRTLNLRRDVTKTQATCSKVSNKKLMSSVQRQKLRRDLEEMSKSKIPSTLLDQIREMGLIGEYENRIDVDVDAVDDITVCKLQKLLRSLPDIRSPKSSHTKYSCGRDSLQKDLHKGNSNSSSGCVTDKSQMSSVRRMGSCDSVNFRYGDHTDSPSVIDSDRPSERFNSSPCHQNLPADDPARRQNMKSHPDFVGVAASNVGGENVDSSCHLPTTSSEGLGWESHTYEEQLSPSKALRAAMLKRRFADTIVKARQKALLNNDEKIDPVKIKQEKERLERQQREEKARIEAQIRAAEAASRKREEMEMKQQREREREAARIELEQVERSVEIYGNMEIMSEIEMLSRGYPLQKLGLFIKDDEEEEEEINKEQVPCKSICTTIMSVEETKGDLEDSKNCPLDVEDGEIAW
ncbi:hypothetical protein ACHQM5_013741 [Ranunculus cassubicifolius]